MWTQHTVLVPPPSFDFLDDSFQKMDRLAEKIIHLLIHSHPGALDMFPEPFPVDIAHHPLHPEATGTLWPFRLRDRLPMHAIADGLPASSVGMT